ncbi:putative alcohol dehydrogenase [Actinoplanes missouriensis 431]|uniref:Putative alcohol dehydrogenase n=1 Tax=Actinoplanes missouriensis (strain ATCC 14538 / DSM 43046 / CBS 188.64 / JCM 3121 / NBRC 102363 / NCIMB 12654 / NRRL B-3342 / UNCC 431) TaxID=512565 RepID=I0H4E1_ACTM4|nr:NADP-dependent oxidoreductase [Actinoplanes missouriensis]BAL87878.1 putative alcohol dehydrogenase [Actinoplanes missouriensis 431]
MRGVVAAALGGPEVLQVTELPDPEAEPGQVVVRIRAVCVHPADLAATTGRIPGGPVQPPFSPGWDIAGEVVAAGPGATDLGVGDRVVGMIPWYLTRGTPGGYAELVAADTDWLVRLPDELDFVSAATVPLNAQTAHQGLSLMSPAGGSILITGASGGVGGFATRLALRAGFRVVAQASHDDEQWVRGLGAHEVIPRSVDLASVGPVGAVFDAVPLGEAAAAAVEDGGVVVTTRPTPPIDPARGVRQEVQLIRLDRELLAELVGQVASGQLSTRVAATMPLTEAAAAHRRVLAGGLRGKLVLTVG